MNIILIGMPACGKSTLGVVLAKTAGMQFVDTDLVIQQKTGEKLQDTIDRDGIERFLEIEDQVLSEMEAENSVISTGGSAVYSEAGMKHLGSIGTIVYIRLSYEEIERRLNNIKTRGIAMRPGMTLRELYDYRSGFYEKYAQMTIDTDGLSIEESIELVLDRLGLQ